MREHIKNNLMSFFIIVTLVNIAIFICGIVLAPDEKLGYTAFIVPVIDGLLGVIPGLVMYSKKELTMKQTIIREIIQMLLIVVLIIAFMFGRFKNIEYDMVPQIIAVAVSVMVIYVLVNVFGWLIDLKTANTMTEDLKKYQAKASGE